MYMFTFSSNARQANTEIGSTIHMILRVRAAQLLLLKLELELELEIEVKLRASGASGAVAVAFVLCLMLLSLWKRPGLGFTVHVPVRAEPGWEWKAGSREP